MNEREAASRHDDPRLPFDATDLRNDIYEAVWDRVSFYDEMTREGSEADQAIAAVKRDTCIEAANIIDEAFVLRGVSKRERYEDPLE